MYSVTEEAVGIDICLDYLTLIADKCKRILMKQELYRRGTVCNVKIVLLC
jgi:hypothetical protein